MATLPPTAAQPAAPPAAAQPTASAAAPADPAAVPRLSCYELYRPPQSGRALLYPLLQHPPWRDSALPSTSDMLEEITRCSEHFRALPVRAREWVEQTYSRTAAVQWVLSSNRLEGLGTQDEDTTQTLLQRYFEQLDRDVASTQWPVADDAQPAAAASDAAAAVSAIARRETLQTVTAMRMLFADLQEMRAEEEKDRIEQPSSSPSVPFGPNDVLLLDYKNILTVHKALTKDLQKQEEWEGMVRVRDGHGHRRRPLRLAQLA